MPRAVHAQERGTRSAADLESARQLYNQGIELRDKGDLPGAREKFRAAHALGNTPVTGIELCKVHASLNQPVEAREICLGVARIPPLAQETTRSRDARLEAGRIAESQRDRISGVRVNVTGVPEGREATVAVDGAPVPSAALSEPRAVNPGEHVVTARVGDGPEATARVETRPGETREVSLVVEAPPTTPAASEERAAEKPASAPDRRLRKKPANVLATVSFVAAGAAGLGGLVTAGLALSAKGSLKGDCPDRQCPEDQWDELDRARTMGDVSTVLFVVTGVALGTGIVATILGSGSASGTGSATATRPPPPKVDVVFGLGGAGVHGTF